MQLPPNDIKFSPKVFSWKDGKDWFNQGVELFKSIKNIWYLNCLFLAVIFLLLANVSLTLVMILVIFASPLVTAFVMNCCEHIKTNQPLNFSGLWYGVFKQLNNLLILGLVTALLSLVMHQIHIQLMAVFNLPVELTEDMMQNMSGSEAMQRLMINLLTNIPVALALAFSPALILLKKAAPFNAIQHSIKGVFRSWKAFVAMIFLIILVFFGAIILASLLTSVLVVMMGAASQFIINTLVLFFAFTITGIGLCCQYQAFIDLFDQGNKEDENSDTEIYAEI